MYDNIWKGKWKRDSGLINELWGTLMEDEIADIEYKKEKMANLLQENGDSKDEAEEHYTLFE